jgi:hypothetical protein
MRMLVSSLLEKADTVPVQSVHWPAVKSTRSRHNHGRTMSKLLRGLAAGYGAKKMGGGCFSTVLIFIVLWIVLGYFGIFK